MKELLKKIYFDLNDLVGIAGFEQDVARYCRDAVKPYADETIVTPLGNVIAKFEGNRAGKKVMITAHMDEVGVVIKGITPNGFLLFEKVGAVQMKCLPGRRMRVRGDKGYVIGNVGIKPGHITPPAEQNTVPTSMQSYIDIGCSSRAEVEALGIHLGSTAVYESPAMELANPDLITGRSGDDRLGCALMIALAKEFLCKKDFAGTVYLAFSVSEETCHHGAAAASCDVNPDYTIAVDTFPAGGTPDAPVAVVNAEIGKGPIMSLYETINFAFIQYTPNPNLLKIAREVLAEKEIPSQFLTIAEALYCNDASDIIKSGSHCPCFEIGIGRRYSHSPAETFSLSDVNWTYELVKGMLEKNDKVTLAFLED